MERVSHLTKKFFFIILLLILFSSLNIQEGNALSRRFSFLGEEFNITPGTSLSDQQLSSVAYNLDDDQWLVAWRDNRNGSNQGIYARRVDRDGTLLGSELVIKDNTDDLIYPSVAYDNHQHRYLVVWQNSTNYDIEGRLVAANGTLLSTITIESCSNCYAPDVVYNPVAHKYLVVWYLLIDIDDSDIIGRTVDGDGNPSLSDILIAINTDVIDQYPSVAADTSDGKYLVVFSRTVADVKKVYGRRVLSNGEPDPDSSPFQISQAMPAGNKYAPDVAFNPTTHRAFVAWSSVDGSIAEIQGRMVNTNLTLGAQRYFQYTLGSTYPAMTYANLGDSYLVIWYDGYDLYGRWVGSDGGILGRNFYISYLGAATAVAFGSDRYLVTWTGGSGLGDICGRLGTAYPRQFLPLIFQGSRP